MSVSRSNRYPTDGQALLFLWLQASLLARYVVVIPDAFDPGQDPYPAGVVGRQRRQDRFPYFKIVIEALCQVQQHPCVAGGQRRSAQGLLEQVAVGGDGRAFGCASKGWR